MDPVVGRFSVGGAAMWLKLLGLILLPSKESSVKYASIRNIIQEL
jgi:hypothetical protein